MPKLGVNVDHVATVRQQRRGDEPDPVQLALLAEGAGADSIVMHLREDRRHIQERDVERFLLLGRVPLHLEIGATAAMVDFACSRKVRSVCLVPERREELTTEGGLDVASREKELTGLIAQLTGAGIETSLFIEPEPEQIEASARVKAQRIELHTGSYANRTHPDENQKELDRLLRAGALAAERGLTLDAGHGLHYRNVSRVAVIPRMDSLNIGFSIISKALVTGMPQAVREMKKLIQG